MVKSSYIFTLLKEDKDYGQVIKGLQLKVTRDVAKARQHFTKAKTFKSITKCKRKNPNPRPRGYKQTQNKTQ